MSDHSKWEADVVLNDGGIATLRQAHPSDRAALEAFYERVSPRSKYLRFFSAHPTLSEEELNTWTRSNEPDEVTLVLVEREQIVGTGRFQLIKQPHATGTAVADPNSDPAPINRVADVSFLLQDDHQGRGGGVILLEHLAQIGRECAIQRFSAEILMENRTMVQVFIRAGYEVTPHLEDGFITVDFSLDPTERSMEVMLRRELRAEANAIRRLLCPQVVAVVGHTQAATQVAESITAGEFTGTLHVRTHQDSTPTTPSTAVELLRQIPGPVDLIVTDHNPAAFHELVDVAAEKQACGIVVLAQGHTPSTAQEEALRMVHHARENGLRVLGPAALGVVHTHPEIRLNATPAAMPRAGRTGLFTQSAGVATLALSHALRRNCALSNFIATGSYADVTSNDIIQFWTQDEHTDVCLLSLDTIGNPRKFFRVLRRLALEKHVVVFIPSRALQSARPPHSELPDVNAFAIDSVIRHSGAIVVTRRDTMFDIAQFLASQPVPAGPKVAIISNSAGLSAQMAQSALRFGLQPTIMEVGHNPTQDLPNAAMAAQDTGSDLVFVGIVEISEPIAQQVLTQLDAMRSEVPMMATVVSLISNSSLPTHHGSIPVYDTYADALEAVSLIVENEHIRAAIRPHPDDEIAEINSPAAATVIQEILSDAPNGRPATDQEAAAILAACGIPLVPWREVSTLEEAQQAAEEFGWNVVLKSVHPVVRGRPELNAVIRNIHDPAALTDAWANLATLGAMLSTAENHPAALMPVVQPTVPPGPTLSIRAVENSVLGPLVSCGMAGVAKDLLHDVSWRAPSVRRSDARAMLQGLKAAPLLHGYKGAPPVDVGSLEDLLMKVARLKDEFPQLVDIELTPVIAGVDKAQVVGARIVVHPASNMRDPLARAM